jgi:class 3 adenylate cyclase/tetratricopeptide (TPR) repeat protein
MTTGEQRKTVTVLFCDLAGSTALGESVDPERLRGLLARYFEQMKATVESHGGTVEKFIGDAVMAVFGVPVTHEDDALRAVRAAAEMRDALPELGLEGRIGVMTGEVITGTEERLVTGDAVNVAARLEQAAAPGQVLIGQSTLDLVHGAVEVEPVEPLTLKGKTQPVAAHRLVAVHDAPERSHDMPFVGRERELGVVREALERSRAERCCELLTVIGEAGVGKSRLVTEALAPAELVVRGRCLPYGDGITYWPVIEVLKQLDVQPDDETAATAIRSLLGESSATTSAEEIAWAFRKTLEQAAASRPLVMVFDDIQWGEQTFHDLVEHVALLSTGAPILLLCMARPELAERRPTWPVTLRLEPLSDTAVDELIPARVPDDLRARIARTAGGNPLFVGEMLAMTADTDGEVVVPPTLQALLAARLDQLDAAERAVLERGGVEGETFHRGAVQALGDDESAVTPHLAALVRKRLIRPDKPQIAGEDGFRFHHLLLRDTAYDGVPKAIRADLHARLADWLEQRGTGLVELDEILGHHLEQAYRCRVDLGLEAAELAERARHRLAAAGRRARRRGDDRAAVTMLRRAATLLPAGEVDLALEADLVDAYFWSGRAEEATALAASIAERAKVSGDEVGELCGRIKIAAIRRFREPGATDELDALLQRALPIFEASGDAFAVYTAESARAMVCEMRGQVDAALHAYERAADYSHRAGLAYDFVSYRSSLRLEGTTSVADLLRWIDENDIREGWSYWLQAPRAGALARIGRFDEARAILVELRARAAELGVGIRAGVLTGFISADVELLADAPAAAAALSEEGCRIFEDLGESLFLSTAAGQLARSLCLLGRLDEAEEWALRARELGAADDVWTQTLWRQALASVLARRGEHAEAERLAREAVAIGDGTDILDMQGDAYADLAEVLLLSGKPGEAVAALEQALERFERKGNLVMAGRMRERRAGLRDAATR